MACNFNIDFEGAADTVVRKARQAVQNAGGSFNGDDNSGSFNIPIMGSTVSGNYTINGQQMAIDITHKPFFVPCGQIQSFIQGRL